MYRELRKIKLRKWGEQGLTLIELLIVIFILSTISFSALALTNTVDEEIRYDDTQIRLAAIQKAVLGESDPVFDGRKLLSGYVADNGILPNDINELINLPTGFTTFGQLNPIFDPQPDANGLNNGGTGVDVEVELTANNETLFKGYRGSYLRLSVGADNYPDGWGNEDGTNDFGWDVVVTTGTLNVTSLGLNGEVDNPAPDPFTYDTDLELEIGEYDWQIDLANVDVEIVNQTGSLFDEGDEYSTCLRVALLEYRNDNSTSVWRRLNTECFNGDLNPDETELLSFAVNTNAALGEHVVVLVEDTDTTPNNGSETLFQSTGGDNIAKRVKLFPKTGRQTVQLIIE